MKKGEEQKENGTKIEGKRSDSNWRSTMNGCSLQLST
jgi:hypothetical protein